MRSVLAALLVLPALAAAQTAPPDSTAEEVVLQISEEPPELIGGLKALYGRIEYPESARQDGVEGQVFVEVVVDREGRPVDPVVLRSPDDRLSEAALVAVRASRFVPGRQGGEAARVRYTVPVTFKLQAPPAPEPTGETRDPRLIGGLRGLQERVEYPEDARRDGVEGVVEVQFVVDELGRVQDAKILRSPDIRLSLAAIRAVGPSQFVPGLVDGVPTRVRFAVPITFKLDESQWEPFPNRERGL